MSIDWTEFNKNNGEYPERFKFENEGDRISGTVVSIRVATMPDGSRYPSLTLNTANGQFEVLASQTQLLKLLATNQPKVGDSITIVYTTLEKIAGGKTMKHFTVERTETAKPTGDLI